MLCAQVADAKPLTHAELRAKIMQGGRGLKVKSASRLTETQKLKTTTRA